MVPGGGETADAEVSGSSLQTPSSHTVQTPPLHEREDWALEVPGPSPASLVLVQTPFVQVVVLDLREPPCEDELDEDCDDED